MYLCDTVIQQIKKLKLCLNIFSLSKSLLVKLVKILIGLPFTLGNIHKIIAYSFVLTIAEPYAFQ